MLASNQTEQCKATEAHNAKRRAQYARRQLMRSYCASIGVTWPPRGTIAINLRGAAEMRLLASQLLQDRMDGADIPADDVIRAASLALRMEKAIGIDSKPAPQKKSGLLREYLE